MLRMLAHVIDPICGSVAGHSGWMLRARCVRLAVPDGSIRRRSLARRFWSRRPNYPWLRMGKADLEFGRKPGDTPWKETFRVNCPCRPFCTEHVFLLLSDSRCDTTDFFMPRRIPWPIAYTRQIETQRGNGLSRFLQVDPYSPR